MRVLDVCYLNSLGASATSSLIEAAETPRRPEAHNAFAVIQARKGDAEAIVADRNWRSHQARRVWNARLILAHKVQTRP